MNELSNYVWAERYRPTTLNNMVLEQSVRETLQQYIDDQDFPHLLFYGPPGSGKTTIAKILVNTLKCSVLSLNASGKDRSIDTMRNDVVNFARSMPSRGTKIKVVFLDEADGITPQAQESLKNTIETYSDTCRFILTANHVNRIIDPLRSRCTEFPFTQFSKEQAHALCRAILSAEHIDVSDADIATVIDRCYPDIRTLLNTLQRCSYKGKFDVSKMASLTIDPATIMSLIQKAHMRSIRQAVSGMTDFMFIYRYFFDNIEKLFAPGDQQGNAAQSLCQHLFYDSTVPDREINFVTLCAEWCMIMGGTPNFNK